jgi:hypothetical protein
MSNDNETEKTILTEEELNSIPSDVVRSAIETVTKNRANSGGSWHGSSHQSGHGSKVVNPRSPEIDESTSRSAEVDENGVD